MTAYHARHESPYDEACPDCNGYLSCCELACYEDPGCACEACEPSPSQPARGCLIGLVLAMPAWLVLAVIVWRIVR